MEEILSTLAPPFVSQILSQLRQLGFQISKYPIDHICYRTSSNAEYEEYKTQLSPIGTLLVESIIGGRLIATYKLDPQYAVKLVDTISGPEPIERIIDVVELPAPKTGRKYEPGLEHFEIVVDDMTLEEFARSYDTVEWDWSGMKKSINRDLRLVFKDIGASVKFHEQTLENVIEMEKKMGNGC